MSRIGNPEWNERSVYDDEYIGEEDELSPFDDDYIREEYRDAEY